MLKIFLNNVLTKTYLDVVAKKLPAPINIEPNILPVFLPVTRLIDLNLDRCAKNEYMHRHTNDKDIKLKTSIRNWGNNGSDMTINWGKREVVNTIALGFVTATKTP